jgi:hypothetical protein
MKHRIVEFVNPRNQERWDCKDPKQVQLIEGIEYMYVHKPGSLNQVRLMRKDSLVKAIKPNK